MIYMTGAVNTACRPHINSGRLGVINTPANGFPIADGWVWAADNGCFGKGYPGDDAYIAWLNGFPQPGVFATAPDVVGDHAATVERSLPMLRRIRAETAWRAAFVAQDGATVANTPWGEFDALFIGGSTEWKLGAEVPPLVDEAKRRGMWVHMGRVNSAKRWRYAEHIGCDSCDGTYLAFGPDVNMPRLAGWAMTPSLFSTHAATIPD